MAKCNRNGRNCHQLITWVSTSSLESLEPLMDLMSKLNHQAYYNRKKILLSYTARYMQRLYAIYSYQYWLAWPSPWRQSCKHFRRVGNRIPKMWVWSILPAGRCSLPFKGLAFDPLQRYRTPFKTDFILIKDSHPKEYHWAGIWTL